MKLVLGGTRVPTSVQKCTNGDHQNHHARVSNVVKTREVQKSGAHPMKENKARCTNGWKIEFNRKMKFSPTEINS